VEVEQSRIKKYHQEDDDDIRTSTSSGGSFVQKRATSDVELSSENKVANNVDVVDTSVVQNLLLSSTSTSLVSSSQQEQEQQHVQQQQLPHLQQSAPQPPAGSVSSVSSRPGPFVISALMRKNQRDKEKDSFDSSYDTDRDEQVALEEPSLLEQLEKSAEEEKEEARRLLTSFVSPYDPSLEPMFDFLETAKWNVHKVSNFAYLYAGLNTGPSSFSERKDQICTASTASGRYGRCNSGGEPYADPDPAYSLGYGSLNGVQEDWDGTAESCALVCRDYGCDVFATSNDGECCSLFQGCALGNSTQLC